MELFVYVKIYTLNTVLLRPYKYRVSEERYDGYGGNGESGRVKRIHSVRT